ncbi:VOC family protein [Solitalea sp. MAHUQ-68]|uniref:VOC family protein n=1 Tax=Solitalea agri TaxID=2953739 RepID=A0A9X2F7P4_9SPHI|nr:VOC family protein [Solitalea agri]MCO4293223.1 VOC family protein [Solitalea agri]
MENTNLFERHQRIMPYLILDEATKFLPFMQLVFDASETYRSMRDDRTIMHAELMIGECTIMYSNSSKEWDSRQSALFIYVDNADVTYKRAIEAGCYSIVEPETKDYGRTGGIIDPFGNIWWITSVL